MRQPSNRVIQWGARGCACSPSLRLLYFCHKLSFFLLYFNSGQNKFSFPEGIPWEKYWDATGIVWLTQALLKTLVARLIQGIPHWPPVTKKNRPSHIAWVQPCTLSSLLEALLAQEWVSSGAGKTNVASQEERPLSFVEGTLTPLPVCACGPWHAARVNSTKGCLHVCVLYLSRNQNTSGPNLQCVWI